MDGLIRAVAFELSLLVEISVHLVHLPAGPLHSTPHLPVRNPYLETSTPFARLLAALHSSSPADSPFLLPSLSLSLSHHLPAMSGGSGASILEQLRILTSRSSNVNSAPRPPPPQPIPTNYYPPLVEADPKGLALRFGGEFGNVRKKGKMGSGLIWEREKGGKWGRKSDYGKVSRSRGTGTGRGRSELIPVSFRLIRFASLISQECVPNTDGTVVANLTALPYCGQYSSDSSFFYTATKGASRDSLPISRALLQLTRAPFTFFNSLPDFRMSLFSTSTSPDLIRPPLGPRPPRRRFYNAFGEMEADEYESPGGGRVGESSLPVVKSFQGVEGGWTVTDAGESGQTKRR